MPQYETVTETVTTDGNGVYTQWYYNINDYIVISAFTIRDGTAYDSWAGVLVGTNGQGYLSFKLIDNGVNPVKSLGNTTVKLRIVYQKIS